MARKIARFPLHVSRLVLKFASALMALVLTMVAYATGQTPVLPADSRQKYSPLKTLAATLVTSAEDPSMDYGIQPLYGIIPLYGVVEYGMPYAKFSVKGTIRADETGKPINNLLVLLQDTTSNTVLDTAYTNTDGHFAFDTVSAPPWNNTWIVNAMDIDGENNGGPFKPNDTLITIPRDSLTGGDGSWFSGIGEADIELFMEEYAVPLAGPVAGAAYIHTDLSVNPGTGVDITVTLGLPFSSTVAIGLFDATGRYIQTVFEGDKSRGSHILAFSKRALTHGTYFLKMRAGKTVSVARFTIAR